MQDVFTLTLINRLNTCVFKMVKCIQHDLVNLKYNLGDLLWPGTTIKWSLEDSCWQNHLILGWAVICIHSWRGHAPPVQTRTTEPPHEADIKVTTNWEY